MVFDKIRLERKLLLLKIIKKHNWKLVLKEYPYMLRIKKKFEYSEVKMNIYWNSKGEFTKISTHLEHPKKGKGQMFRVIKDIEVLEQYLINPRKHSKGGYGRTLNK